MSTVVSDRMFGSRGAAELRLRALFTACGVGLGWMTIDVAYALVAETDDLRRLTIFLLPLFAATILTALLRLGFQGPGPVRLAPLLAGAGFLVAGAGLDIVVTVRSDPELTMEANPYIRTMLEIHGPWSHVYGHAAVVQFLFIAVYVAAWWAFLRHRAVILRSLRSAAPRSWPAFLKAATGGGRLTYRQWLLPLRPEDVPNPYHSVWPVALTVAFGTSLFRYWAAAEWLDLVRPDFQTRAAVLAVGIVGTLVAYFGWLALVWRWSMREPAGRGAT